MNNIKGADPVSDYHTRLAGSSAARRTELVQGYAKAESFDPWAAAKEIASIEKRAWMWRWWLYWGFPKSVILLAGLVFAITWAYRLIQPATILGKFLTFCSACAVSFIGLALLLSMLDEFLTKKENRLANLYSAFSRAADYLESIGRFTTETADPLADIAQKHLFDTALKIVVIEKAVSAEAEVDSTEVMDLRRDMRYDANLFGHFSAGDGKFDAAFDEAKKVWAERARTGEFMTDFVI